MTNLYSPYAPQWKLMSRSALEEIHRNSCFLLEKVGVNVFNDEAIRLLKDAGALVRENHVRIPSGLVEWAIKSAPSRITVYDRLGNPKMYLEGTKSYFGTGSDCPNIIDHRTGERRKPVSADIAVSARLCDGLDNIDFLMSMGLITDVPKETAYLHQFNLMVNNSSKPMTIIARDAKCLNYIIEMASLLVGGEDELQNRPIFVLYDEPSSPMQHSDTALEKLLLMAHKGLPTNYSPGAMAGATCPVTPAGAVIQATAEILSGLVIHQLKRPGAPFVFGAGMSPMDMGSMQPTYCAPEAMLTQAAVCQLAQYYNLPSWGFAGCSGSKTVDEQAALEAGTFVFMAGIMGTNLVHDLGYLEFGLTFSNELLVICNEAVGQVRRILGGVPMGADQLAVDVIERVGPGGNYLGDEHTFQHFRKNWQPEITDRRSYEQWTAKGSTTMKQRAQNKIEDILDKQQAAPLSDKVKQGLIEIIAEAELTSRDR
ncbi:MAG: trimethylamine methyltransferase family protein [Bacillota bacterium]